MSTRIGRTMPFLATITRVVLSLALAFGTYLLMAGLLYGSCFLPIWLLTVWRGHIGASIWVVIVLLAIGPSAYLAFFAPREFVAPLLRPSLFVVSSLTLCTLAVGFYVEVARSIEISRFSADRVMINPFFQSLREAPREFQVFLHAAALKDCVPYAWSYGEMAFYRLEPDTAVNVLPPEWIERCAIRRTDRR